MTGNDLLEHVLGHDPGDFALLHRPDAVGPHQVEVFLGHASFPPLLRDIPLSCSERSADVDETLVLIPYQQVVERGFHAVCDGSTPIALSISHQSRVPVSEVMRRLPSEPITLTNGRFEPDDEGYAAKVQSVLDDEIGAGQGSNFVIKRSFLAQFDGDVTSGALCLFKRLLAKEAGAYWTFVVRVDGRIFVGASPERHVSLSDGVAAMTPISGTYRYPASGPVLSEVLEFLKDAKETDELYMVLDEELKMMATVCGTGGRVVGPFLREMSRLAHTEYVIEGRSDLDPRDILHETLLAPTITGSPLENACRVVARHEGRGRGFYGGVAALIGRDASGNHRMDSAILIRTADMRPSVYGSPGQVEIGVGATLVRGSTAASEIEETHAKAAGMLAALGASGRLDAEPTIQAALGKRNDDISQFWLSDANARSQPRAAFAGLRALCIDAEDTFSSMLAHQLRAIGLTVHLTKLVEDPDFDAYDLVVMGPGPGDPRDLTDPRIASLSSAVERLLAGHTPFLAVCLSHQLLCQHLGLQLTRRPTPNQGTQIEIDLFGQRERVGFYNSFVAVTRDRSFRDPTGDTVQASTDAGTGEVYALRGPRLCSVQFHPESVLTKDGERVLGDLLSSLLEAKEEVKA